MNRSPAPRIPRIGPAIIPCRERRGWYEITPVHWALTLAVGLVVGTALLGVAVLWTRVFA